jgi:hypothetical protein
MNPPNKFGYLRLRVDGNALIARPELSQIPESVREDRLAPVLKYLNGIEGIRAKRDHLGIRISLVSREDGHRRYDDLGYELPDQKTLEIAAHITEVTGENPLHNVVSMRCLSYSSLGLQAGRHHRGKLPGSKVDHYHRHPFDPVATDEVRLRREQVEEHRERQRVIDKRHRKKHGKRSKDEGIF